MPCHSSILRRSVGGRYKKKERRGPLLSYFDVQIQIVLRNLFSITFLTVGFAEPHFGGSERERGDGHCRRQ
jgi:hypothetical protein